MKKNWIIWSLLGLVVLVVSACKDDAADADQGKALQELFNKQVKEIETHLQANNITAENSGIGIFQEVVTQHTSGQRVEQGDLVLVNYKIKTLDGTVLGASEAGKPERIIYARDFQFYPQMLFFGFSGKQPVHVGGTYRYYAPSYYGFGKFTNEQVPANSNLVLEYEIVGTLRSLQEVAETEQADIKAWLEAENITAQELVTGGLHKAVLKEGAGAQVAAGDSVKVRYKGYLLSKEVFDDNLTAAKPLAVKVGTTGLIPGFTQALKTMNVGEKSLFLIPSAQAYGVSGGYLLPRTMRADFVEQGLISAAFPKFQPLSTLIFEIELLEKK